jgi:Mn-dependent DtxR family transcriptional regulator
MENKGFFTFSESLKKEENSLTASMEDYLEMIYRLCRETGFTRIHTLSQALNVQPPSTTKMMQHLSNLQLVKYERYGVITLTDKGKELGAKLLKRHDVVESFMRLIGVRENRQLEETEKIEHMLSNETVQCFEIYVEYMTQHPEILKDYKAFQESRKEKST